MIKREERKILLKKWCVVVDIMCKILFNINGIINVIYRVLDEVMFWGCWVICLNCFKVKVIFVVVLLVL